MVQTKAGAARSEWLKFVRECAIQYRARKNEDASTVHSISDQPCTCRERGSSGKIATVKGAGVVKVKAKKAEPLGAKFERP
jgi:hypothetical protein